MYQASVTLVTGTTLFLNEDGYPYGHSFYTHLFPSYNAASEAVRTYITEHEDTFQQLVNIHITPVYSNDTF